MATRMTATARRRQLLHAAITCFAEHGYRGTTTAKLARAAKVTEPVLYRHFKSKHDLFVAMLDEVAREVLREWRKAIAPLQSPRDQLRVLLRLNPATTDVGPKEIYRVVFNAQAEFNEPDIQGALRRHYETYARFLTGIVKKAQRAKQVRADVSAEGLAWQLIHAGIGFALLKPLQIPGHATPATVEQTISLLLELLSGERLP